MRKTMDEMLSDVFTRLRAQGGITETSPGSVARMFAEVILEQMSPLYDELDLSTTMSAVSTAIGPRLDLVAELVNCVRLPDEPDDDYRARIVNQVSVQQNANLISLRIRALQINGVADVQFKRFTQGAGSFTCYVIPQVFPITNDLLAQIETVMNESAAYGMAFEVKTSTYVPVDLTLNLIFRTKSTSLEREYVRNRVISNVTTYMKELNMGNPIIINEVVQRVMETSEQILDMEIKELRIDSKQYFVKNVEPSLEQQYYLRTISVA